MAVIIEQKSRYLRRASLCYDAVLLLQREKAAEMVRLANIYADLADTLRDEKESEDPNCTLCGLRMAPKRVLHATEVFPRAPDLPMCMRRISHVQKARAGSRVTSASRAPDDQRTQCAPMMPTRGSTGESGHSWRALPERNGGSDRPKPSFRRP
jgi:hypothetical protein